MPARNAADRRLIARIAADTRWAREPTPADATRPARAAWEARFVREADPDGVLPPDELARRVAHLKSAHMRRLALKSAQSRRAS